MKWVARLYQQAPEWFKRHAGSRRLFWIFATLIAGFAFFWSLIEIAGLPARRVATYAFVVVWFFHLIVGVGAGYAIWKIWPERRNKFVEFTSIHLNAAVVDALAAIVMLFMAQNVRFTWKFSIAIFAAAFLRDLFRVPLIFYVIRGPGDEPGEPATEERSVYQI